MAIRYKSASDNDTHGAVIFALQGDRDVEVNWNSTHDLHIGCLSCRRDDVTFEAVKSGGVVIGYSLGEDKSR